VRTLLGDVICPTSFPNPVNFGAAFSAELAHQLGAAIATEARALWLAGATEESEWSGRPHIAPTCWAPNININRDPRWGRNQEVPSEEPLLNADFGVEYTRGLQGGEDGRYTKTVVTLKHWAAYSLEDADGFTRHNFNAQVSPYSLSSTYLPAFRAAVTEGGAQGVMCSYNSLNGVPTCASPFLRDLLRGAWGFGGYITSDTGALSDIWKEHKYLPGEAAAACAALVNGTTDVSSDVTYHASLLGCDKAAIDAALMRTFRVRFQLGLFDPIEDQAYWKVPLTAVGAPEIVALNRAAAESSIVLLKNAPLKSAQSALPLRVGQRLAVVGPHAQARGALVGNYLGQLCPDDTLGCVPSIGEAVAAANRGGVTRVAAGPGLVANDTAGWAEALAEVAAADAVVLALGIDGSIEAESLDRTSIDLPAVQHAFAAAVAGAAAGKPVAVVLVHGGSLDVAAELAAPGLQAVLDAFYPGAAGAAAIAGTLFGTNQRCCGKMPYTVYPSSYVDEIRMSEMELDVGVGRSYRYYRGRPVVPFGFGLALARFELALRDAATRDLTLSTEATPSANLTFTVRVSNTGGVPGDEVVQAFFAPLSLPTHPASRLQRQLFAYTRVHLPPGGTTDVAFTVSSATLRLIDKASGSLVSAPGQFALIFTNGADQELRRELVVSGDQILVRPFPY
jgi:beta-D-xylosidase 4